MISGTCLGPYGPISTKKKGSRTKSIKIVFFGNIDILAHFGFGKNTVLFHVFRYVIALFMDFDDLAAFATIFNEVFEISGLMAISRQNKNKPHEKYRNRAFWQHRNFSHEN